VNHMTSTDPVEGAIDFAEIGRTCLCLHARMTARALTRHYNQELAPSGLEVTEFSLLGSMSLELDDSITDMAKRLAFERSTLVRSLKRLERRGLISTSSTGGRAVKFALTPAGRMALQQAQPLWLIAQLKVKDQLPDNAEPTLMMLDTLRRATPSPM